MNQKGIRELKAIFSRLYEKAEDDDPDRKDIEEAVDELDKELKNSY